MKYLSILGICLLATGCIENKSSTSNSPQNIIETGYLRCTPSVDACNGALSCADQAGNTQCIEAEADACSGEVTCACEGQWICGDRPCADVENGFECLQEVNSTDVCEPADCGEAIDGAVLCDDGSATEATCERGADGVCAWAVSDCPDAPPQCQVADCGEPIAGGTICEDGTPPAVTCERAEDGLCAWVVEECDAQTMHTVNCEAGSCGRQPMADIVCENGLPPEQRCSANEENVCEWQILECQDEQRDVAHSLTLDACPPVEMTTVPFRLNSAELEGDTLYVGVEYGGGCGEHDFTACPSDFQESVPLQMRLGLYHETQGDFCEAIVSEMIAIDVSWIRRQHLAQYGEANGRVSVTIDGPQEDQTVLYEF